MKNFTDIQSKRNHINEGFFDFLTKKKPNGGGGFLGCMLNLGGLLGKKESKKAQTLAEKMREITEKSRQDAKKRIEDLKSSAEASAIAKLEAKYQAKKNQLDLANNGKIRAYEAQKAKYERQAEFWKSNQHSYSQEYIETQMEQMDKEMESLSGMSEYDGAEKMKNLANMIFYNEDGSIRDPEEIKKAVADPNSDLGKLVAEYNTTIEENGDSIMKAITANAKEIQEQQKKVEEQFGEYKSEDALDEDEKFANEQQERLDNRQKAHKYVTECKKKREELQARLEGLEGKKPKVLENSQSANEDISKIFQDQKYLKTGENGGFEGIDEEKIREALKAKGVPTAHIDKLIEKAKTCSTKDDFGPNGSMIEAITSGDCKISNDDFTTMKEEAESKRSAWESEKKTLEGELKKVYDPTNPNLDQIEDPELKHVIEAYNDLPDEEKASCDPESEAFKTAQRKIEESKAEIKEQRQQRKEKQEVRKQMRKQSVAAHNAGNVPAEIQAGAKDYSDSAIGNDGEEMVVVPGKDGKPEIEYGYYDYSDPKNPKWVSKKEAEKTKDGVLKYQEGLKKSLIERPMSERKTPDIQITKNNDGTYDVVVDGETHKGVSADVASAFSAQRNLAITNSTKANEAKKSLAKKISDCIDPKTGKLKPDKLGKLSKEDRAQILRAIQKHDQFFDGVDNDQIDAINGVNKDNIESMAEKFDVNLNADDWEEVDDEDLDAKEEDIEDEEGEEKEVEVEDEENAKNADGDELVKGEDGKWYKKNSDGTPDKESGEQTNKSTKKEKKKILSNPAKIWKRRKKKSGEGMTKSYFNKGGDSISEEEYKEKMAKYKEKLHKSNESLSIYLQKKLLLG